ncbi:MAG: PepSY-associated TM helix domain-containing protein [Pseudomonadota bacterium]
MNGAFRQSMTWLHTWTGLVFCWILYFMFVTGTLGYVDAEIDRWMQPEQVAPQQANPAEAITVAARYLEREAPGADRWFITPPGGRDAPHLRVFWQLPTPENAETPPDPESLRGQALLDLNTGEPLPEVRETGGGQVLYRMHYLLHYLDRDIAYRFIGVVTMLMFVGLITGIVVHKKIFKEFFTFRAGKGQRSWLDMHNLLSVTSLPFQLMITYSGLIFMVTVWMPGIALGTFGFDAQRTQKVLSEAVGEVPLERAHETAPLVELAPLVADAEARWDGASVTRLEVKLPGDANAEVSVSRSEGIARIGGGGFIYSGTTGAYERASPEVPNAPIAIAATLIGLHEGLFAGPVLRWLYLFSGLIGTAMVATGAVYWTAKRRRNDGRPQSRGYRFVDALNVGTIMGLPVAVAAYFWANRLLPTGMEHRADWEVHTMFLVWGLCLVHPVIRSTKRAWIEQAWFAAVAFALIPVLNALTTQVHLGYSLRVGDWVFASFDLVALATGVAFAAAALIMRRRAVGMVTAQPVRLDDEPQSPLASDPQAATA